MFLPSLTWISFSRLFKPLSLSTQTSLGVCSRQLPRWPPASLTTWFFPFKPGLPPPPTLNKSDPCNQEDILATGGVWFAGVSYKRHQCFLFALSYISCSEEHQPLLYWEKTHAPCEEGDISEASCQQPPATCQPCE